MPVQKQALPRPTIGAVGGTYRKLNRPVPEDAVFRIRHPETGAEMEVSRQNVGDMTRNLGWEVIEDEPTADPATSDESSTAEEIKEVLDERNEEEVIPAPADPDKMDELQLLRHKYTVLTGETADHRWGKKKLQEALDAAPTDEAIAD